MHNYVIQMAARPVKRYIEARVLQISFDAECRHSQLMREQRKALEARVKELEAGIAKTADQLDAIEAEYVRSGVSGVGNWIQKYLRSLLSAPTPSTSTKEKQA